MNKKIIIILIKFATINTFVLGQKLNNSPYTRYGLGEISEQITSAYFGVSGASVAFSEHNHLNISNPASYSSLIKYKPIFDVGVLGKVQNLKTENNNSVQNNIALRHFSLGMPIGLKTGIAFGLIPYSTVGYDANTYSVIEQDSVRYNYQGKGGLNKVFLGIGQELVNKGDSLKLSIGTNISYLFGVIENSRSVIYNNSTYYNSRINNYKSIKGISLNLGTQYSQKLNNKISIALGVSYTLNNKLNINKDYFAYSYKYSTYSVIETPKDTIDYKNNIKGKVTLPTELKIGGAITFNQKLTTSIQYEISSWARYNEVYYNDIENTPVELNNSNKFALGITYRPTLPKEWNNKNRNILQKSTYRLGLKTSKTNITVNNTNITDYGISFGVSVPLISSRSLSSIDLGVDLGKLGTTKNNLIEDNYIRFYLGFSLSPSNYDRWFRKRKYD